MRGSGSIGFQFRKIMNEKMISGVVIAEQSRNRLLGIGSHARLSLLAGLVTEGKT
jgi:hypothetical protein